MIHRHRSNCLTSLQLPIPIVTVIRKLIVYNSSLNLMNSSHEPQILHCSTPLELVMIPSKQSSGRAFRLNMPDPALNSNFAVMPVLWSLNSVSPTHCIVLLPYIKPPIFSEGYSNSITAPSMKCTLVLPLFLSRTEFPRSAIFAQNSYVPS